MCLKFRKHFIQILKFGILRKTTAFTSGSSVSEGGGGVEIWLSVV